MSHDGQDWLAQEVSALFLRYRPSLVRQANRMLGDPTQAEEVVQDAFLYLLTSMCELDSELNALQFLKWKVRLLCLDVIRLRGRSEAIDTSAFDSFSDKAPGPLETLERADDAAIVALALAKLEPTHREVIIATLYEEKRTREVASQMGMSENAVRQLLFRARASFKRALVGESEIKGLSISQILSIAAKKAATEKQQLFRAGVQVAVLGALTAIMVGIATSSVPTIIALPDQFEDSQVTAPSELDQNTDAEREPSTSNPVNPQIPSYEGGNFALARGTPVDGAPNVSLRSDSINPFGSSVQDGSSSQAHYPGDTAPASPEEREFLRGELLNLVTRTLQISDTHLSFGSDTMACHVFSGTDQCALKVILHSRSGASTGFGDYLSVIIQTTEGLISLSSGLIVFTEEERLSETSSKISLVATDLIVGDLMGNFGRIAFEIEQPEMEELFGYLEVELTLEDGVVVFADFKGSRGSGSASASIENHTNADSELP